MNYLFAIFFIVFSSCQGQAGSGTGSKVPVKTSQSPSVVTEDVIDEKPETVLDPSQMPSPIESIKLLDKKIEDYHLGQNLTQEQIDDNLKLKREIIRGTFDINELCRLSLTTHWETITADQRKLFVTLMTRLLEKKAILSKEQVKGNKSYSINYQSEKFRDPEKTRATVKSKLVVPKDKMDFDLTYEMLLTPYGWKIFDVIVDDASLLTNYKFQFDKIISKNGFDDLVKRMQTKLDTMK